MAGRFEGKTAFVTGGGRGMGRAIAERFAAEGAAVTVSARTEKYGRDAVAAIESKGGKAALTLGDISSRDDMKRMVEEGVKRWGGLDIVVHCAADVSHGLITEMDEQAFDTLVHSNVHSLFWLARDTAPYLSKAKDAGRLIYISSGGANRQFLPGLTAYTSSKAFMNCFARGLAVELGHSNILVNVIEPGLVASDRMREMMPQDLAAKLSKAFPVPRPGESKDVAAAVLFMASNEASYITGTTLLVDGGASMVAMGNLEEALA